MDRTLFDLTDSQNDIKNLRIEPKSQYDCTIKDRNGIEYQGFILAKTPVKRKMRICEWDFHKSDTDNKYQARPIFKVVYSNGEIAKTYQGKKDIRISFRDGEEGYREFWRMIAFLYKWRKTIDLEEFDNYFSITEKELSSVLTELAKFEDKGLLLEKLQFLSTREIDNIRDLVSIAKIKNLLKKWDNSQANNNERFWHELFKKNTFILSQIFAAPYIFIDDEFYCGGKKGNNKGGIYTDFIYQNQLTNNIAFIEIKTPIMELVNPKRYRGTANDTNNTVHSISQELTGGINEVLNQRNTFIQKKDSLEETEKRHENFRCILIGGMKSKLTEAQLKSFELFRGALKDVDIITYDELFARIDNILQIFKL